MRASCKAKAPAKFVAALQQAGCAQALPRDPAATEAQRLQRDTALRQHDWVVYAKSPLARKLLAMPQPSERAAEAVQIFMRRVAAIEIGRCCYCANGRWQLVCERSADRLALAALPPRACRGPP